jgi:hypothetical protein
LHRHRQGGDQVVEGFGDPTATLDDERLDLEVQRRSIFSALT